MCNECKIDYSLSVITTTLDSDQIKIFICQPKFVYLALCTLYFHVAIQRTENKWWDPPKTAPGVLKC